MNYFHTRILKDMIKNAQQQKTITIKYFYLFLMFTFKSHHLEHGKR